MADSPNPLFARFFDRVADRHEARGQADLRRELLRPMTGYVVELGAGNGLNFPHYPPGVRAVTAVEPEPYLRERAQRRARSADVDVRVVAAVAENLPLGDANVDGVVLSGVLCSVPDVPAALGEVRRVLRPGGLFGFYEHVRSRVPVFARYQDAADRFWPRLMGGCHPNRDPLAAIQAAGFTVERCRGLIFPPTAKASVVSPRILGLARRT